MKNNKIFFIFLIFITGCASNSPYTVIDTSKNIKIENLESKYNRVIGTGTLSGNGKANFSSPFIFESQNQSSYIVFKDFLGRRKYMVDIDRENITYIDLRSNQQVDLDEFQNFFPISDQLNAKFYKNILWGDPRILKKININLKNFYSISTKLKSFESGNFLDEIIFSLNNSKQVYSIKFNRRNFKRWKNYLL